MARARNIKPGFFKNEDLAELAYEARLLFIGTWTLADREGRLEDRPKKIKMDIFPADSVDVNKLLLQLHESKFILRYEIDGKRYIQVMKFMEHQNPHYKEPASILPAAPESLRLEWIGTGGESEADDLFKDHKTRGSPKASPSPASGLPEASPGPARLISDSGFSDSGFRTPDSLIPEGGGAVLTTSPRENESAAPQKNSAAPPESEVQGQPQPDAGAEAALRKLGVTVKRDIPARWADGTVPIAVLTRAVGIARQRKPGDQPIPVKYLEPIVEELLAVGQTGSPAPVDPNAGSIVCDSCGKRARNYTGRQCDPCWRIGAPLGYAERAAAA